MFHRHFKLNIYRIESLIFPLNPEFSILHFLVLLCFGTSCFRLRILLDSFLSSYLISMYSPPDSLHKYFSYISPLSSCFHHCSSSGPPQQLVYLSLCLHLIFTHSDVCTASGVFCTHRFNHVISQGKFLRMSHDHL